MVIATKQCGNVSLQRLSVFSHVYTQFVYKSKYCLSAYLDARLKLKCLSVYFPPTKGHATTKGHANLKGTAFQP